MEQYYYNHMNKQEQAAYHGILQGISAASGSSGDFLGNGI